MTTLEEKHFLNRAELRSWLESHHQTHAGLRVRVYKKSSTTPSVAFEDLLEEGLCFGWSESKRLKGTDDYYYQVFTPRKSKGTTSERNKRLVAKLEAARLMTDAGRAVL